MSKRTHKNPTVESLRAGQTIHEVYALGSGSFIKTFVVLGKPFVMLLFGDNVPFLPVRKYYDTNNRPFDSISLRDVNVVPNHYNRHRIFYSRKKALAYLKEVKTSSRFPNNPTNSWMEML